MNKKVRMYGVGEGRQKIKLVVSGPAEIGLEETVKRIVNNSEKGFLVYDRGSIGAYLDNGIIFVNEKRINIAYYEENRFGFVEDLVSRKEQISETGEIRVEDWKKGSPLPFVGKLGEIVNNS